MFARYLSIMRQILDEGDDGDAGPCSKTTRRAGG